MELDPKFGIWEFSAIVALFFERPKIKLILTSSLMAIFIWNLHAKSFFIFLTYTYCLYYTSSGHNKYFRLCFKWVFVSSWSSSMCRSVIKVLLQKKAKQTTLLNLMKYCIASSSYPKTLFRPRCDGKVDCEDGEDERDCKVRLSPQFLGHFDTSYHFI